MNQKVSGRAMIYKVCGQNGAKVRRVARTYGKGQNILVIENVPVVNCPHCGESYRTTAMFLEIESIKLYRKSST